MGELLAGIETDVAVGDRVRRGGRTLKDRARRDPGRLRGYVGKRLPLKVIEADQRRDRLSLSDEAAATSAERRGIVRVRGRTGSG